MDAWPVQLQQKLDADSFKKKFGNTSLRTEMDVGKAKVRSRYTDGIDLYNCSIVLDFDDYDVLEDFFKITLDNGTQPFTFTDPFSQTSATFRFIGEPEIAPMGGRVFKVSMNWEKIP